MAPGRPEMNAAAAKFVRRHAIADDLDGVRERGADDRAELTEPRLRVSRLGGDVLVDSSERGHAQDGKAPRRARVYLWIDGAEAGTRTLTGILPLRPERSASANSATPAGGAEYTGS